MIDDKSFDGKTIALFDIFFENKRVTLTLRKQILFKKNLSKRCTVNERRELSISTIPNVIVFVVLHQH